MNITVCMMNHELADKLIQDIKIIAQEEQIPVSFTVKIDVESLLFFIEEDPNSQDLIICSETFEGDDGIEMAKTLREKYKYKNELIFVAKDGQKVFDSFEAEPLNYILDKKEYRKKLKMSILRAYNKMQEKREEMLSLSWGGESRNIYLREILYLESEGRVLNVYYGDHEMFQFYSQIGKVENLLFNKGFIRIHKSIIVAVNKIRSASRDGVVLVSGQTLPVGRVYYKQLKEEIKSAGLSA